MGIQPLPMLLSLLAAAAPLSEPQPMAEEPFQQWLLESDLQQLELGCGDPLISAGGGRRQQIRDRLLVLHPAPQSFERVMANASALLTCGSPDSAARVLNRISPAQGEERRLWLRLRCRPRLPRWITAKRLTLRRLVNGDLIALADLDLGDAAWGWINWFCMRRPLGARTKPLACCCWLRIRNGSLRPRSGWLFVMTRRLISCWSRRWIRRRRPGLGAGGGVAGAAAEASAGGGW